MKYQVKNWMLLEYWDEGIVGVLFDYNFYVSQYDLYGGDDSQNISVYGMFGFNFGVWCLCLDYQYN